MAGVFPSGVDQMQIHQGELVAVALRQASVGAVVGLRLGQLLV